MGWGNIKYVSSGDQALGLKMVLPDGDIVCTGSSANPNSDVFFRYGLGADLTGLFIGAEGAYGVMTEIMQYNGPDSFLGYMVSTMYGSTETTFYVLAVYFGAVGVKRTRHALPACLAADLAGILAGVLIVNLLFG